MALTESINHAWSAPKRTVSQSFTIDGETKAQPSEAKNSDKAH